MSAISVRQLAVTFAGRWRTPPVAALQPLDLEVGPGKVLGVLGQNGSGKTTLLRVLAGLQRPTSGSAAVLSLAPDDDALRRRVAWQPEGPPPLQSLSGREVLQWFGAQLELTGAEADDRVDAWLERFQLQHAARRPVRTYSTGMQRRLMLSASLLGDPQVLLLDEPTSGLDPLGSELAMEALRERARSGAAIVLASHHLLEVEQLCDEVLVLHRGRAAALGTLDELLRSGERALVVRDLRDDAIAGVAAFLSTQGATLVRTESQKEHLYAFYRRLAADGEGKPRGER